jgi:hypothetical protein
LFPFFFHCQIFHQLFFFQGPFWQQHHTLATGSILIFANVTRTVSSIMMGRPTYSLTFKNFHFHKRYINSLLDAL